MIDHSQNILSKNTATQGLQDLAFLQKRRLTIEFDSSNYTVFINKNFTPPVSWFLTDENGELAGMGQIEDHSFTIELGDLCPGIYYLRIAGEVHLVSHGL